MEIQKVIQTIQDLCRKTVRNGCTENEAMAAAHKIGQLMKVYNLSMDKVFLGETKCVQGTIETGRRRRHPIDGCVKAIAEFCDCRIWFSGWKVKSYQLFGLPTDVEMAKYLYSIVWDAMETAIAEFKRSENYQLGVGNFNIKCSRKTLSVSFQKGMANRIYHRLVEMMNCRHQEEYEEAPDIIDPETGESTGTSLIVVKKNKVETEFEELGIRLKRAATTRSYTDRSAWGKGQDAGNKVNLNRPIGHVTGYLK